MTHFKRKKVAFSLHFMRSLTKNFHSCRTVCNPAYPLLKTGDESTHVIQSGSSPVLTKTDVLDIIYLMKTKAKQPIPAFQMTSLRAMLASKIKDAENFRRILLTRSHTNRNNTEKSQLQNEVVIYQEAEGNLIVNRFVYEDNYSRMHIDEQAVLDRIEQLIGEGYDKVTCESFTGVVNVRVSSGRIEINLGDCKSITGAKEHPIEVGKADRLLKALDILTSEGEIRSDKFRKYEQINHFIELIRNQLEKVSPHQRINIVDCGCGKSYLSFVMNYFLSKKLGRRCKFFCIDTSASLIERCKEMQAELDYANMEFQQCRIIDFELPTEIDILCSLHACDTATDEAIALGIKAHASLIMVVPCCQSEILNQLTTHPLSAITRHGVFGVKFADLLTDALRVLLLEANGYKVRAVEFVSPIHTPKNILILAEKIQARNSMALKQYRELVDMFQLSPALERFLTTD